jgi:hypothetical protein
VPKYDSNERLRQTAPGTPPSAPESQPHAEAMPTPGDDRHATVEEIAVVCKALAALD